MACRPNQVSMPNPEFGVDFDASARAMHQSASKGSLMVHDGRFLSMPAAVKKSFAATMFERNTMLKTLKRKIALVAVAGLGFGLVSTVPALALAAVSPTLAGTELTQAGSTLVVTNDANLVDTAKARAGAQTIVIDQEAVPVNTAYDIYVSSAAVNAVNDASLATLSDQTESGAQTEIAQNAAAYNGIATANKSLRVTVADAAAAVSTISFSTSSLSAGTWNVIIDPSVGDAVGTGGFIIGTITVYNVGAPVSVAFKHAGRTKIAAANAYDTSMNVSLKDSAGRSTFLRGSEQISYAWDTVATGVQALGAVTATSAGDVGTTNYATTAVFDPYTINIDATDIGGGASTVDATPGVTYKLNATIISGLAAFGSASATYRVANNTNGLAGTLKVFKTADDTQLTSLALAASGTVVAGDYYWELLDSTGAVVEGVTPVAASSAGSTVAAAGATNASGAGNAFTYTAAATAGTDTISFTVPAGSSAAITASVAVTVTGYGATAASLTRVTVKNVNGTALKAGIAPAYTAALNVSKVDVTITGLDANRTALFSVGGTFAGGATANTATLSQTTPAADASGSITVTLTVGGGPADAGDTVTVTVDPDGVVGGAGTPPALMIANITFAAALADVTTSPLASTNTFAAAGASVDIVATAADQFGVIALGSTATFTNTIVPAGATKQTGATLTVGSDGKATFKAVLGTQVGTYTYQVTGRKPDGGAAATTSTISFTVTASGAPKSLTITSGANTATATRRVIIDDDGDISTADANKAAATLNTVTTLTVGSAGTHTVMTVKVTDDAGAGAAGVVVTAVPGDGVLVNSAAAANVLYSAFNSATTDLAIATDATGVATFYVTGTKKGVNSITFKAGSAEVKGEFTAYQGSEFDDATAGRETARTVSLDKATADVAGDVVQITATVKDVFGNGVAGVTLTGALTGTAGRFAGGARTTGALTTNASGQVVFEVTSNGTETGTATLTVAGTDGTEAVNFLGTDLTANGTIFSKTSTKSTTAAITVKAGSTVGAATETAITNVKNDVKAVSDTVKTLSNAVTTIQSSVTELTSSFSAQIKSLSSAIAKISRAIAALSKRIR